MKQVTETLYDKIDSYNETDLTPSDRKTLDTLKVLFAALLDDNTIEDYISERKELCDWGELEALTFHEKMLPFIRFLKERAEALTCSYVIKTVDNYDCEDKDIEKR